VSAKRLAESSPASSQGVQLVPIQRLDLFATAMREIENFIEANSLSPGDRLPSDRDLAVGLGVSRPLVRQALKVLEGLGRVSAKQGAGTFVRDNHTAVAVSILTRGLTVKRDDLKQLLAPRIAVEVEVLEAAFQNRTPNGIATLEAALSDRASRLTLGPLGSSLDLSFEAAIGAICGNELLRRVQGVVHGIWLTAQIEAGVAPDDSVRMHAEHRQILKAFIDRDVDHAISVMRQHLNFQTPDSVLSSAVSADGEPA
jgi:GntR family transcriptional repressor for pyruvate dehydrogenase complex